MFRNRKVIRMITAVLLLLVLLSGCGKSSEPEPTPTVAPVWTTPEPDTAPEQEAVPEVEPAAEPTPTPTPEPTPEPLSILHGEEAVNSLTTKPGATIELTVQLPAGASGAASFESSNTAVATVDENGVVTAVAEGTAEITCRAQGAGDAVCKITVVKPAKPSVTICFWNNPVYDFTLNASSSETLQLRAVISPSDTEDIAVWSVTDPNVADVSPDGLVTALSEGSAKIVCQVGEGKAECWVRVKGQRPAYIPVENVTTEGSDPALIITYAGYLSTDFTIAVGQSLDLNYKFLNADSSQPVSWSVEDQSIAVVDQNGTVTGLKKGNTKLFANSGSLSATCIVRISE